MIDASRLRQANRQEEEHAESSLASMTAAILALRDLRERAALERRAADVAVLRHPPAAAALAEARNALGLTPAPAEPHLAP